MVLGPSFKETVRYSNPSFEDWMKITRTYPDIKVENGDNNLKLIYFAGEHIATYNPEKEILMTDNVEFFGHGVDELNSSRHNILNSVQDSINRFQKIEERFMNLPYEKQVYFLNKMNVIDWEDIENDLIEISDNDYTKEKCEEMEDILFDIETTNIKSSHNLWRNINSQFIVVNQNDDLIDFFTTKEEAEECKNKYLKVNPSMKVKIIENSIKIKSVYTPKVNSSIRSARYIATDPESGEVLGSADTYEEAVNQWGEDVTITDSKEINSRMEHGIKSSSDDLEIDNKWISEGMRVTWGEGSKGKVIDWDDDDVLIQVIDEIGQDYFVVGYNFKLTGTTKEPHIEWVYGDYNIGDNKKDAMKYFENRRKLYSSRQIKSSLIRSSKDIESNINEADFDIFSEEITEYIPLFKIKKVDYIPDDCDLTSVGFDGGYEVVLKNGIVKYFAWNYGNDNLIEITDLFNKKFKSRCKSINSNHQFNKNIVSKVFTNELTDEQAIQKIAIRNNCNAGYAKNIFNKLMKDENLISSGLMMISDELNKEFDVDGNLETWTEDYVPVSGHAITKGGEIIRAANRIIYRYENDGDEIGRGYGKETVNPAARYIVETTDFSDNSTIERMLAKEEWSYDYEDWLEKFKRNIEDYLRDHEELFHTVNKDDMWNYKTEDDRDTSVDECYIEDEDGNQYWFAHGDGGWICEVIEYNDSPEFEEDEYLSTEDVENYIDDPDDDYVDFEDSNGFRYSAEKIDGDWKITHIELADGGLAEVDDYWSSEDFEEYDIYDTNGRSIDVGDLI